MRLQYKRPTLGHRDIAKTRIKATARKRLTEAALIQLWQLYPPNENVNINNTEQGPPNFHALFHGIQIAEEN